MDYIIVIEEYHCVGTKFATPKCSTLAWRLFWAEGNQDSADLRGKKNPKFFLFFNDRSQVVTVIFATINFLNREKRNLLFFKEHNDDNTLWVLEFHILW